jgi:hypothetical protein
MKLLFKKYFFTNNANYQKDHHTFYKFQIKYFSLPLSFKNKINSFFKIVHPDILGKDCPPEYRRENEKSVQNLNSYLDCLDKGNKFENKNVIFYVAIGQKNKNEEIIISYQKFELKFEDIKIGTAQSNRVTLQLKYEFIIII